MITENQEDKPVIFNTPAGFNFQTVFGDLSIKFKPKVEFLIHQINFYDYKGGYQVHSKNHKWFFGIKGTELALMLRRLIEAGIIKLVINFTPGNTSNTYKMVTPFSVTEASTQKSFYYPHEILFIKKWVADGYIVKSAATSKFKKEQKVGTATIIAEQQKQINQLQEQVLALLAQFNSCAQPSDIKDNKSVQVSGFTMPVKQYLTCDNNIDQPLESAEEIDEENEQATPQKEFTAPNLLSDDEREIEELALMFSGRTTTVNKKIAIQTTTEELPAGGFVNEINKPTVTEYSDSKISDTGKHRKELFRGNLTVHHFDEGLMIEHGDAVGMLTNYEVMKSWCENLNDFEKHRLFHHLISSKGSEVKFPLNMNTKALFTRKMVNGTLLFDYLRLSTE